MLRRLQWWAFGVPLALLAASGGAGTAAGQPRPAPSASAAPARSGRPAPTAAPTAAASATAAPTATPPPPATDEEKAEAWYREALEAGKADNWSKAYELLLEAVRLKQSHDILGNLGTAEFRLGRYRDATEHFTASLKLYPVNGRPEGKAFSQSLLDEAKAQVGTLVLLVTPGAAKVLVNGVEYTAGERDVVFVEPGEVTIEVGGVAGYEPQRKKLTLEKGKSETVTVALATVGGEPERPSWVIVGVGAGVAAAALGVGVGLGFAAKDAESEWRAKGDAIKGTPGAGPCPASPPSGLCKEANDAIARHDALVGASIGLYVAAGLVGAATAVYGLWPRKSLVRAAVGAGPTGATLVLTGAF